MTPTPEIPHGPLGPANPATKQDGPLFAWTEGGAGELRDVSKPIVYDERGNPLYALRGILFRLW
jgi:hypothetical protein